MAPSTTADASVLNPIAVFAMQERGVPMPAQVILEACDTSALNDTVSGEWLTIAPAFVSAGAREVVATVYPLPDLSRTNDPLLTAALRGTSLRAAVAGMQREGLVRWKSGHSTGQAQTPFAWGAYATVAVRPEPHTEVPVAVRRSAISKQAMAVLRMAVRRCQERHAKRLDSGYLLGALLDDDELAELLEGGWGARPGLASLAWSIGPEFCSGFLGFRDSGPLVTVTVDDRSMRVPMVVIQALRAAQLTAERDGLPLSAQHIIDALLRQPTAARRILEFLCTLTHSDSTLITRGLDFMFGKQIGARLEPATGSPNTDMYAALAHALLVEALGRFRRWKHPLRVVR